MDTESVLVRRGLPLALLSGLLIAPPAWAAPQTIAISDPADASSVISGGPEPDIASVIATQDGSTISVSVTFHGPALATNSPRIFDTFFPLSVGRAQRTSSSDPNSSSSCSASANMNVRFSTGSPYGDFTVSGSAGSLPFTSPPAFNDDRTQLTWGMTHSSFASDQDCIKTGPFYANIYSTASHPDSYYNSSCRCWLRSVALDRLGGGDEYSETTYWFPGKTPPPSLHGSLNQYYLTEGQPVQFGVYAGGSVKSSRTATVKWFQGATLVQVNSGIVSTGKEGPIGAPKTTVFNYVPPTPGSYSVELSHDGGVVSSTAFQIKADPNKPVPVPPSPTVTPISIGKKPPIIKGKAVVGKRLKVNLGTLAQSQVRVKYQWYVNGKKIRKATRASYTIRQQDAGKKLKIRLVASKSGTESLVYTTKAVKVKRGS